ncbi:protein hook homolog [Mytilus edulis]|uniref:protein hook homolog n=1 Tax=Mytilus edulis TaxID=6550 RepID=UPI0039EF76A3
MDGTNLPDEIKDKVVFDLFRDSFFHIASCVKDEVVLPDIRPKFPDLEEDYKQGLGEDEKYILFKTTKEDLVQTWGKHIEKVKKANTKEHECKQILGKIWNIRKEFLTDLKNKTKYTDIPTEEPEESYVHHMQVLLGLEQLLGSKNFEHSIQKKETGKGQIPSVANEDIEKTVPVDESNVPSTNQPDSDNDDIETTKSTRHRQNKIQETDSSHKLETESIDSGLANTTINKSFNENKEELERDKPMETSNIKDVGVVKMETDDASSMENSRSQGEIEHLKRENEELQNKLVKLKKRTDAATTETKNQNKEIVDMTVKMDKFEKYINFLKDEINSYESDKKKMEENLQKIELENRTFKDEIDSIFKQPDSELKKRVKSLEDKNKKYLTAYKQQKEIIQTITKENENYQQRLATQRPQTAPVSYAKEYRDMKTQVESLKVEKESLMQRLSMVAGRKMKDNNPAIADLSDSNRPEKLSEQFREIYDNAWTDVLDYITDTEKVQDDVIVKQIVCVLQQIYDQCKDQIANRKLTIIKSIGYPEDTFQKQYTGGKDGHDPTVKIIKDLVQGSANRICDNVIQDIKELAAVTEILQKGKKKADEFVTKCSMLCLFMVLQDPPVVLDFSCKPGDPFNMDLFSPFTSSGDVIDYLVWPVMFLSENGALMSKGIAQGKKKKRKKKMDEEK